MKGLRCLPGEQPGRGSLISERKELKAAPTFPPQLPDAAIRQHLAGFPLVQSRLEGKRSWPDPGSLVVVRLGELCLLRFHPPKQLLVFARELGVCSELAPCVCVCWEVWEVWALALSRWPEEPAGGRRQEENKGSPVFGPTRLLPGLQEQLRGV